MRQAATYGTGVVLLVVLTVLIFAADMPEALSVAVQVLWVALIVALCFLGARDIRRSKLDPEGRPLRRGRASRPGQGPAPEARGPENATS